MRFPSNAPCCSKNNGILPLDPAKKQTLAVIGPNANSRAALVGNYEGTASRYVTVLEGIQDAVGPDTRVLYAQGCHLYKDRTSGLAQADDRISEAKAVCAAADVIVAVVGLDATIEGEEAMPATSTAAATSRICACPACSSTCWKRQRPSASR